MRRSQGAPTKFCIHYFKTFNKTLATSCIEFIETHRSDNEIPMRFLMTSFGSERRKGKSLKSPKEAIPMSLMIYQWYIPFQTLKNHLFMGFYGVVSIGWTKSFHEKWLFLQLRHQTWEIHVKAGPSGLEGTYFPFQQKKAKWNTYVVYILSSLLVGLGWSTQLI